MFSSEALRLGDAPHPSAQRLRMAATVVWFLMATGSGLTRPAHAQTLADLAQIQRQKIEADSRLASHPGQPQSGPSIPAPLAGATPNAMQALPLPSALTPSVSRPRAELPSYSVTSLYTQGGRWVAELTDGHRLLPAQVGMRVGGLRIEALEEAGVRVRPLACKEMTGTQASSEHKALNKRLGKGPKVDCHSRWVTVGGKL